MATYVKYAQCLFLPYRIGHWHQKVKYGLIKINGEIRNENNVVYDLVIYQECGALTLCSFLNDPFPNFDFGVWRIVLFAQSLFCPLFQSIAMDDIYPFKLGFIHIWDPSQSHPSSFKESMYRTKYLNDPN